MMNIFLLLLTLELSYQPCELEQIGNAHTEASLIQFDIMPELEIFNGFINIKGNAIFDMTPNKNLTFDPFSILSIFDASINYSGFSLGFSHSCKHPIVTDGIEILRAELYNYSGNKFYLRYTNKE